MKIKYEYYVRIVRDKKELFEHRLKECKDSRFKTDLMCNTWLIATDCEWLKNIIADGYFDADSLTRNQYRLLKQYVIDLSEYFWKELYKIANEKEVF